jgi:hypothetical protein
MPRTDPFNLQTFAATALATACIAGLAVATGMSACITAPPPPLPELPQQRPQILQSSVFPPPDLDLTALPPNGFIVPLLLSQLDLSFQFEVYVDFNPGVDNSIGSGIIFFPQTRQPTPASVDAGIYDVSFTLLPNQLGDPNDCHLIQFFVADYFNTRSPHTPGDSLGSDSVTWHYVPDPLNGCLQYDAGSLADGPPDSPPDAQLQIPDVVGPL